MNKKIILFLIVFIFSFISINVYADKVYYINGTYVRMRSDASKDSEQLLIFPEDAVVTLNSTEYKIGPGCSDGWYNVSYNGQTGYVCKTYVSERTGSGVSYGRPWTTPKKSIVGGAEFIYKNYLSDGQYNSYLKKFNVNPNSPAPFNNQYMTNITAPSSEAKNSYSSYIENGLFNNPLVFEIPIFDNMPSTSTYNSSIATLTMQDELVYDANDPDLVALETKLNAEGFDESYKLKLRALHKKYPNLIFESLDTGYDFKYAAERQKTVGAFPDDWGYCESEKSNVESGWCTPTYAATEMYLDPRNFLHEKYILQFESLFYNSVQTEVVVQTMLKGTAMEGNSALDNQTFASIFVEAGSKYNVSPVYLASLARQETGNGTGFSARGESFTYEGVSYAGNLYNYFNIGAKSSADNPVLAGLVYASAGLTTGSTNNSTGESVAVTSENTYIQMLGISKDSSYLKGYNFGTTVSNVKTKVNGRANVVITNSSGTVMNDTEKIGTGSKLTISDGTSTYSYTVVIKGDITGDGEINSADLLKVRQYLIGTTNLSDSFKDSADINKDGKVNSADLLMVRKQLLGTYNIVQG